MNIQPDTGRLGVESGKRIPLQTQTPLFLRYVSSTLAASAVGLILGVAFNIIAARSLGVEARGVLALLIATPFLAVIVGDLGLSTALAVFLGNRRHETSKLTSTALVLAVVLGLMSAGVLLVLVLGWGATLFPGIDTEYLLLMVLLIIPITIYQRAGDMATGLYRMYAYNLMSLISPIASLSFLLLFVVFLRWGLEGALVGMVASIVLAAGIGLVFMFRTVRIRLSEVRFPIMRSLVSFGLRAHLGNVLKDMNYRVDIYLVNGYLGAASLGYYTIAVLMAQVIWRLPNAIGVVLLPHIAGLDAESARRFTPVICRHTVAITTVACIGLAAVASPMIVLLFGEEFKPAVMPMLLLLPGILLFSVRKILANDMVARGFPGTRSIAAAVSLPVMLILDVVLIPIWGVNGASVASTISYGSATLVIGFIYLRTTGNSLSSLLFLRKSDLRQWTQSARGLMAHQRVQS